MEKLPLQVRQENRSSLIIDGLEGVSEKAAQGPWVAHPMGDGRILLRAESDEEQVFGLSLDHRNSVGRIGAEILGDVLRGFQHSLWTGMVSVDTGFGTKRLFFNRGDLVFAASSVIDDRLGETIFRDGVISLDELTLSAAKVTRDLKFGQVLVGGGIFDTLDLWKALSLQVRQIVYSVFMAEQVFVELFPHVTPSTEVVFSEGNAEFLDTCMAFGSMFRTFASRLSPECQIQLSEREEAAPFYPEGTFVGDFLTLISEATTVARLLELSKVQQPYTLAALLLLVNRGFCEVVDPKPHVFPRGHVHLLPLKSRINAYEYMVRQAQDAFVNENKDFPNDELKRLASSMNPGEFPILFLNNNAHLSDMSLAHMFSQCLAVPRKVASFTSSVNCLIRFILQVVRDQLSRSAAENIHQIYRNFGQS